MQALVLIGLALVASASAVKLGVGYHEEVGIPLAEKIRVLEEKNMAEESQNRIVGGSLAPTNSHPYFAGLMIDIVGLTNGYSVCGSTLVSTNRLVTAAHCWWDGNRQAWRVTVILGTKQFFTGGTRIATTDVVLHPQYTANTINDIAMIRLPRNVAFSNSIRPIALPTGFDLFLTFEGSWAVVAGYGRTSDQQTIATTAVSHVNVQVVNEIDCAGAYGPNHVIHSTICTSGRGRVGPCIGDSGGPLVINRSGTPVLIGVVSFVANAGCQVGLPAAYARVTSFNNFILQNLGKSYGNSQALLLVGLALVASASAVKLGVGYHEEVGIPLAEKIRVLEEKNLAEEAQNRIVGGSLAPANSHPYFAGLMIDIVGLTNGYSVCGSTLVSANRLVTAAHCWWDGNRQAWRVTVILSTKQFFTGGTRIATTDVVLHSQYTANIFNDIAMIRLPTNVAFSNSIQPISLPTGFELFLTFAGSWAVVAGYGRTSDQQTGATTAVSHVNVQVVNEIDCAGIYGDSGGPLVSNRSGTPVLIGVVSFVSGAGCQAGLPAAYARVTSFNNFILQNL